MEKNKVEFPKWLKIVMKIILIIVSVYVSIIVGFISFICMQTEGIIDILSWISMFILPLLILPLILVKNKKAVFKVWLGVLAVYLVAVAVNVGMIKYDESITINTSPNINLEEYLPFDEESKIVTLGYKASLQLEGNLPIIDGAAAVFPVYSLTTEQIQGIYGGEITNWKEVGGRDEEIVAFQRNEGSGSQSMLLRFMDGKEVMDAPSEMVNDFMLGIIEQVADYRSKRNSMGFSFRYYVEGIIQNPDIKVLSVDGIAPTVENIKNGKYPITTPLYAVTYEGNDNENVDKLLQWVLSEEGQEIIEKTGYAGVGE